VYTSASERPSLSRRIVRSARRLSWTDLAPEVVDQAKVGLLDMLSCALEARRLPWGEQAIRMVSGSDGKATVIGTAFRVAASEAAFANAVLAHSLLREDMHTGAVSHLGVVVYPVLLALAQQTKVSGRDFILAAVCGYEIGAAVGRAMMDLEMVRRFRPTGFTGPLAGAVAGSRLLGLEEQPMISALGFAANAAGGLNEWPYSGGDEMFFHPGFAARNAITSIELAQLGARASETALDGRSGLFAAFDKSTEAVHVFRGPLEILAVYHKPAPACNYAQTACQAALALDVPSAEIISIMVKVSGAAANYPGCDYAGPFERILQAKMSIQYSVAAALSRGGIGEANYHLLSDPEILRLAGITTVEADPELTAAYPNVQGAEVVVTLRSGEMVRKRLRDVVPATAAEIRARFRSAAGSAGGVIEEMVEALERLEDVGRLAARLRTT
jgi:2-methylcitrate dehydratase PrpD